MSRTCHHCDRDCVVSKHEFETVFRPTTIARHEPGKVEARLGKLFAGRRSKTAREMLDQFLSKTPDGHPTHICSSCLTPQHWQRDGNVVITAADAM